MKILASLYLVLDVEMAVRRDDLGEQESWTEEVLTGLENELAGRLLEAHLPPSSGYDPEAKIAAANVSVSSVLRLNDLLSPGWTYNVPEDPAAAGWEMQAPVDSLLPLHPQDG